MVLLVLKIYLISVPLSGCRVGGECGGGMGWSRNSMAWAELSINPRKLLWAFLLVKDPFRVGRHGTLEVTWKSLSRVRLFSTPWIAACQAPPSMEFSRQEYWSGLPFPSPTLALVIPKEPWLTVNIKEMWRKHWAMEFTSQELCARAYNKFWKPQVPQEQFQTAHTKGALQEQLATNC